ncbi:hypothetical protein [Pseudoduganella sp. GCM10020061]|uniref:hypothetical protein n=1 Tax=Pseudoduganella sp. GCM10020061 TaxID=3317345 RepID=UPI0036292302
MRVLALLLVLCWPLAAEAARTPFQARCEDTIARTTTTLVARQAGYLVDNTKSFHQLTQLKEQGAQRGFVLGLTRTESHVTIDATGSILHDRDSDYECIAPHIVVNLWYSPITVYISREFGPGTCPYREVLSHELRHVKLYTDHMEQVARSVRAALAARFGDKPMYAPRGQSNAMLGREIDTRWIPYIKAELTKVEPVHAAIDSYEEYSRLSKVCAGAVQSIIGPASSRNTKQ